MGKNSLLGHNAEIPDSVDVADQKVSDGEEVIFVHGTFASSSEDCGEAWWQVGSETYDHFRASLPEDVHLPARGRQFRWSGNNDERARNKAAVELLEYIAPLEAEGRPYHLIGHSHGGSVIWAALRLSKARKTPLIHLQSWSTVGTPFLVHRSRSPWNAVNLLYMLLAAVLLLPSIETISTLVKLPWDVGAGKLDQGITMRYDADAGPVVSLIRAPIIQGLKFAGIEFTETEDAIRIGSYSPDSDESVAEFLFMSIEGWTIIGGIALFAYITLLLGAWFIGPVVESLRIGFERRLEQRAFDFYKSRWLGIRSRDDEAINGLRATLDLSISFVSRLVPRERIFLSDSLSLVSRPWFWIMAPMYNRMVRPVLDTVICGFVVRAAQGNNRPAAHVVDVATSPLADAGDEGCPPIPAMLEDKIVQDADRWASDLGPRIRQLLAKPSFTAGLEGFGRDLNGRELVHTSYFAHQEIILLLAANVLVHRESSGLEGHAELHQWFWNFKSKFAAYESFGASSANDSRNDQTLVMTRRAA